MIRIECDNCDVPFEVDDDQAGAKAKCPKCGDVNRVPESRSPAKGGDDLPPETGPEQEICEIHPAMFRAHPFRALAIVVLVAVGTWLVIAGAMRETSAWYMTWPGLLMILGGIGWWGFWYVSAHLWVKLRISNKRTIRREGIVRRHTSEVLHDHVRNVEIKQNVLQRMLNVGYLGISSSGQDGIEIEVADLPRPYELKALIDRYRAM